MKTTTSLRARTRVLQHALLYLPVLGSTAAGQEAVVNAPVAPDAIYVARSGAEGGLSVIDLNGFGASTGTPLFSPEFGPGSEGQTRYPFNPNVALQGQLLLPPLLPGTTTIDGGSGGVFTLTQGSDLDDLLLRRPAYRSIVDMALGAPLDLSINNSLPFGCTQGGGNICATTGLQIVSVVPGGPNTVRPAGPFDDPIHTVVGGGNPISFAPHPNPPPRVDPPLCTDPLIAGLEPTAADTDALGLVNLLVPGDPFGNPTAGIPPSGLLAREQNAFFSGPSPPQAQISLCRQYIFRQQIGHFLYLADRAAGEVVVVNSNSFVVLDRIAVGDPSELAMSPNVDLLAVTDRAGGMLHFIDIDPSSSRFHEVVQSTSVGALPSGVAWDPGNEDVLVCSEGDDTIVIVSAFSLTVRKIVTAEGMRRPFAVAITPRQDRFGFQRDVYFGWILDRAGALWLFESGPDGDNGWGFDDIIGRAPFRFSGARSIQPDHVRLEGAVWIAHHGGAGGTGAVTSVGVDASFGRVPLLPGEQPNLRDITFSILETIGSDQLTGVPESLAFDNQRNLGVLPNVANAFSAGTPAVINGKGLVRELPAAGIVNTNEPAYLFVSVRGGSAGTGAVDVIDLATGLRLDTNVFQDGVQSIPTPGARLVMDYFRQ